ncbi:MAG TPA: IS21-like element helper ATPase IstB [bacterium]|nr:IS21-like element helper ATPase IstB [bacterium]HNT67437.1 IS21-like element helper ATPase IstB [bacterium]HOY85762.1 IS21-like element helper ATPase IstB [Candidatus Syntrophosphaera sp.]
MHQQLLDQISELKLKGLKEAYLLQMQTPNYIHMPFEERLAHLIDAETINRKNCRIKQYLRAAKLKYRNAFLEDIEYLANRNLERSQIATLAKNQWIEQQHNIIIEGATGTGKTYIACALAHNAIVGGYSAYYARISKLLSEIKLVRADGSYLSFLKRLTKMRVLILDDFGVAPMDTRDAQELLEIIEDRVGSGSTIITSQLPVENWHDYLSNGTVADAVLDRLVHNSYRLNLEGDTMRKRNKPV